MSDSPPSDAGADGHDEFALNIVSPGHCVCCNACHARFRSVGATCLSCGADYTLVGVTILPLTAADELFEPRSARLDRRAERHFRFGFWRLRQIRH